MSSEYFIDLFDKTRLWIETAPSGSCALLFISLIFLVHIWDLMYSLCDYINNRAWLANDYEKALYFIKKSFDDGSFSASTFAHIEHTLGRPILRAYSDYSDKLDRKNSYKNFLNKIKNFFRK